MPGQPLFSAVATLHGQLGIHVNYDAARWDATAISAVLADMRSLLADAGPIAPGHAGRQPAAAGRLDRVGVQNAVVIIHQAVHHAPLMHDAQASATSAGRFHG